MSAMTKSATFDSIFKGTAKPGSMLKQITKRLTGKEDNIFPLEMKNGKIKLKSKK